MGSADAEHGLDEVFAVFAEDPGDADDEVFVKEGGNGELSVQLGASVDVEGAVVLAVGLPGVGALAVKDVVGREVEHLCAGLFGGDGDVAGAAGVDGGDFGDVVLVLGGVDGGPGGAVDDGVGAELIDGCGDGGGVSDVELDVGGGGHGGAVGDAAVDRGDVGANGFVAPGDGFVDYIVAELAAHAGDEYFHGGLLFLSGCWWWFPEGWGRGRVFGRGPVFPPWGEAGFGAGTVFPPWGGAGVGAQDGFSAVGRGRVQSFSRFRKRFL